MNREELLAKSRDADKHMKHLERVMTYRPNIFVRFLTWLISWIGNSTDRYDRRHRRGE